MDFRVCVVRERRPGPVGAGCDTLFVVRLREPDRSMRHHFEPHLLPHQSVTPGSEAAKAARRRPSRSPRRSRVATLWCGQLSADGRRARVGPHAVVPRSKCGTRLRLRATVQREGPRQFLDLALDLGPHCLVLAAQDAVDECGDRRHRAPPSCGLLVTVYDDGANPGASNGHGGPALANSIRRVHAAGGSPPTPPLSRQKWPPRRATRGPHSRPRAITRRDLGRTRLCA
jgi:hypothetical protein